jgi:hypothetical protein
MSETYEIRCGSRSLTLRDASTPQHAVVDYLRSLGCRDAELVRLGPDGVAWRGAVYTAVRLPDADVAVSGRSSSTGGRR